MGGRRRRRIHQPGQRAERRRRHGRRGARARQAPGSQTAQASSAGLGTVTFTQTAQPANPTSLVLVSGDAQTGAVGTPLADSLVVRLLDGNGNGVGGKAISWVVGTGGGSPSPAAATTNPNGFAATQWTLGPNAGSNLLNAVFSGVPSVPFTANAQAGAATKLAFTQPPVNQQRGQYDLPRRPRGNQGREREHRHLGHRPDHPHHRGEPGGGTLSGTTTVSAVNGVAVFSNLSIDKTGDGYTLTATSAGLTGATSPPFDILTGSANHLVFLTGPTIGWSARSSRPLFRCRCRTGRQSGGRGRSIDHAHVVGHRYPVRHGDGNADPRYRHVLQPRRQQGGERVHADGPVVRRAQRDERGVRRGQGEHDDHDHVEVADK